MILYRTCTARTLSPSLKFVTNSRAIPGVVRLFGSKEMIDDVFSRTLPIPSQYQSRFGPPGFWKNVLYSSETKRTTLFEFSYHLLKNPINHDKAINASTFELNLITSNRPIDVSQEANLSQILNRTNYQDAHVFVNHQNFNQLDIIKYPNVRDPQLGGINYAIFKADSVKPSSNVDAEDLILIPRSNNTVEVQRIKSSVETIAPLMK